MKRKLFLSLFATLLVGCGGGGTPEYVIRAQTRNAPIQERQMSHGNALCGKPHPDWISTGDVTRNEKGKTAQQWTICMEVMDDRNNYTHQQTNNRIDTFLEVQREQFLRTAPIGNPAVTCLDEEGNIFHDRMGYQSRIGQVDANGNIQLQPGYDQALSAGTRQRCN